MNAERTGHPGATRDNAPRALLIGIGLISAAALAYEILLIRVFALVHWQHLVAIAISLALLGYGASGSFLALLGKRLDRAFGLAYLGNALLFSVSVLICVALAQRLPLDPQALAWDPMQILYLLGIFLVLAVPFFAAANCIGLTLWRYRSNIPRLYGMDLLGAGIGGLILVAALNWVSPATALLGIALLGLLVSLLGAVHLRPDAWPVILLTCVVLAASMAWLRPEIIPAPYKDLARALTVHGAGIDRESSGLAGLVSVVRNDKIPNRSAAGMSLHALTPPPAQMAVFLDGDRIGAIGIHEDSTEAETYYRQLLSTLPYELRHAKRVAILHAALRQGVQQALALGADEVVAVEPLPQLHALLCTHYAPLSGGACDPDRVDWQIQSARSFMASSHTEFDLISLTLDPDPGGVDALKIGYEFTQQAFDAYLQRLEPNGLLAIETSTRLPPQLALRLLHNAAKALRDTGVERPAEHIVAVRGWQRLLLLVSHRQVDDAERIKTRAFARDLGFDLVWLPDIQGPEVNRFQQISGAPFYQAAQSALRPHAAAPEPSFTLPVGALSDDRPFTMRNTPWSQGWRALVDGDPAALAQFDAGLLIGSVTLMIAIGASLLLILLPLLLIRVQSTPQTSKPPRLQTLAYFGLLGLAFLFLEIAWIQRLQLFLGHPLYATITALSSFLVFAGLGSLWSQQRARISERGMLHLAVALIVALGLFYLAFLGSLLNALAGLPLPIRAAIAVSCIAPLAFAMGIPFPIGLRRLGTTASSLVPWAWGINGCASVISAAAVPLLALEIGFSGLMLAALTAYLLLPLIPLISRAPIAQRDRSID